MRRVVCVSLLAFVAACPPPPAQPPAQPQLPSAGCPSASGVFLASYATQEPGKGRTGWVMPLFAPPPASLAGGADVAAYAPIDATTAKQAGVPAAPAGNLWLVSGNAPPCQVKLGSYYAANIENHVAYGVEIDGCPAPSDPQEGTGVALVSQDPPSSCTFVEPQPVAARLGQMTGPKSWQKPDKETPMPPEIAALVPPHDCTEPSCEKLWAVGEVKVGDKPVAWAAAVNWLALGDPVFTCDWKAEHWSGFFAPDATGNPVKVETTHPLALSSVLTDRSGARVLLAEGPGEYATYDVTPDGAKLGHDVTWLSVGDDEWATIDRLGPLCEPDPKPQSPY
jgi:hypothetical protein